MSGVELAPGQVGEEKITINELLNDQPGIECLFFGQP